MASTKESCVSHWMLIAYLHILKQNLLIPLFQNSHSVTRDLALLCDETIPVRILEKAIMKGAGNLLETIQLFDVYQGQQIENGKGVLPLILFYALQKIR